MTDGTGEMTELAKDFEDLRRRKDEAYTERNQLVAVLSKLWPSHLCIHPEADKDWDSEWRTIVCIHSPVGQLTWHIHHTHIYLFYHLPILANHWDGHTTADKYQRLREFGQQSKVQS